MQRTCIFRALRGARWLFLNSVPLQNLPTHNKAINQQQWSWVKQLRLIWHETEVGQNP